MNARAMHLDFTPGKTFLIAVFAAVVGISPGPVSDPGWAEWLRYAAQLAAVIGVSISAAGFYANSWDKFKDKFTRGRVYLWWIALSENSRVQYLLLLLVSSICLMSIVLWLVSK